MINGTTGLPSMYIQVFSVEKNPKGRHIMVIHDSQFKMKALAPSSWDPKIEQGAITQGSVIQIDKYVLNDVQGKKMCVILELEVLQQDCVLIGHPKDPPSAAPKKSGF